MSEIRNPKYSMLNDRAFQTCSTFLPSDTSPNPMFNQVNDLWESIEDSDVIDQMAAVVEMFIVDGELDEEAYLNYVDEHFSEGLDGLIDAYENGEPVQPAMPPAPSPKILYNRVSSCDVVDLGSGDCEKLKRCQGNVTAVDIDPVDNPHYSVHKLDAETELLDFMEIRPDAVVTSFNTLSQLSSLDHVKAFDGIHVTPDMNYVKEIMEYGEDHKGPFWGAYRDRDNGLSGDEIVEGYLGYNTFQERRVRFSVVGPTRIDKTLTPQCTDIYYRPIGIESTPKYDGECMFLVVKNGLPLLLGRGKRGYRLSGRGPDMVLMLEKLPRVGKPQAFCLLRIMEWRNYYPFHGKANLWNFFKQVNIRLGGIRIFPPDHKELSRFDVDGQIFRIGQLDYRFKDHLTVDIYDPASVIKQLEDSCGYVIDCPDVCEGLGEYVLENNNGAFRLVLLRQRTDKVNATSIDRITRMMQWV